MVLPASVAGSPYVGRTALLLSVVAFLRRARVVAQEQDSSCALPFPGRRPWLRRTCLPYPRHSVLARPRSVPTPTLRPRSHPHSLLAHPRSGARSSRFVLDLRILNSPSGLHIRYPVLCIRFPRLPSRFTRTPSSFRIHVVVASAHHPCSPPVHKLGAWPRGGEEKEKRGCRNLEKVGERGAKRLRKLGKWGEGG